MAPGLCPRNWDEFPHPTDFSVGSLESYNCTRSVTLCLHYNKGHLPVKSPHESPNGDLITITSVSRLIDQEERH
jgi:hypothetical protein